MAHFLSNQLTKLVSQTGDDLFNRECCGFFGYLFPRFTNHYLCRFNHWLDLSRLFGCSDLGGWNPHRNAFKKLAALINQLRAYLVVLGEYRLGHVIQPQLLLKVKPGLLEQLYPRLIKRSSLRCKELTHHSPYAGLKLSLVGWERLGRRGFLSKALTMGCNKALYNPVTCILGTKLVERQTLPQGGLERAFGDRTAGLLIQSRGNLLGQCIGERRFCTLGASWGSSLSKILDLHGLRLSTLLKYRRTGLLQKNLTHHIVRFAYLRGQLGKAELEIHRVPDAAQLADRGGLEITPAFGKEIAHHPAELS
ncbi:hypothetical protein ES703_70147 [subsurface metagenome]